jgi:hypothetical protein
MPGAFRCASLAQIREFLAVMQMMEGSTRPTPEESPPRNRPGRLPVSAADVRAGEETGALLMALPMFLMFASPCMLETVREAYILTDGHAGTFFRASSTSKDRFFWAPLIRPSSGSVQSSART